MKSALVLLILIQAYYIQYANSYTLQDFFGFLSGNPDEQIPQDDITSALTGINPLDASRPENGKPNATLAELPGLVAKANDDALHGVTHLPGGQGP